MDYDILCIWQSVGADIDNGFWSMYGARLGTYFTMLQNWDYRRVQDFDELNTLWNEVKGDSLAHYRDMGNILRNKLNLPIVDMGPTESKFFKQHYNKIFKNRGIMIRE